MENIEEHIEDDSETLLEKTGYDAVPIHFRPGKNAEKRIKLVVPGIEPPLLFATITDGPGDTIVLDINEDPETETDASIPEGDLLEADEDTAVDNVDENVTPMEGPQGAESTEALDAEGIEDAKEEEENMEAMDNIIEEMPDAPIEDEIEDGPEEEVATDEEEVDEHAGILIALDSDAEQQVIVVRAMANESDEDAVKRVLEDNEGYRVGSLDEAVEILGHSPLTSKDN